MSLPTAVISITCGSCGSSLDHDGDVLYCQDCGLDYSAEDPEGVEATYRDEDTPPCGKPHHIGVQHESKPFHTFTDNGTRHVLTWRDWTHTWGPCHLPATHTGLCDWPVTSTYEMRPA